LAAAIFLGNLDLCSRILIPVSLRGFPFADLVRQPASRISFVAGSYRRQVCIGVLASW
jgi:hypothetical protein